MNRLAAMRSEWRAALVYSCLMVVSVAVAGAGIYAIRSLNLLSQRAVAVDTAQYAVARNVESQVLAAHVFLERAGRAQSAPERRLLFESYARELLDVVRTLEHLAERVPQGSVTATLIHDFFTLQRLWSQRAREFIAALEDGAGRSTIDGQWEAVESAFALAHGRAERIATEGLQPAVSSLPEEIRRTTQEGVLVIVGTLAAGLFCASILMYVTVTLIRSQRLERERENDYRDFDRRLQRAFQLVDSEADVLRLVSDVLDHVVGPHRSAELILSDASRTQNKRIANAGADPDWKGCPVPMLAECPTVQTNSRMIYPSNATFEACRFFRERRGNACSAACVPVSVMGRTVGVVHVVGPENSLPDGNAMRKFDSIARKAGDRIGLARALMSKDEAANTDMLTGLFNRRALEAALPGIRAEHDVFAVVYGDLDHFKRLNDEHGHDMGDRALRLFAQVLRNSLRPGDFICRWGGEEFVVVMAGSSAAVTVGALERVRSRLRDLVKVSPVPAFTTSFGVSDSTMAESFEEILHRADTALMRAKKAGRDCVIIDSADFSDADDDPAVLPAQALDAVLDADAEESADTQEAEADPAKSAAGAA